MQRVFEKISNQQRLTKKYIKAQKLKLKHQRISLKSFMTENQYITFASYKIAMQIAKCQKRFAKGEFLNQCFIKIYKSLFFHFQIILIF